MNKPSNNNNKRSRNNRRNHSQNRRRRPNPKGQQHGPEKITKTYYVYIEKIQIARRKYYDDFHHQDPNRVKKLRRNFENAIEEFRRWESNLSQEQRNIISSAENLDLTYSTIKEISPIGVNESDEQSADPHFVRTQKDAIEKYRDDEEESVGTMDDYRSYKNI